MVYDTIALPAELKRLTTLISITERTKFVWFPYDTFALSTELSRHGLYPSTEGFRFQ